MIHVVHEIKDFNTIIRSRQLLFCCAYSAPVEDRKLLITENYFIFNYSLTVLAELQIITFKLKVDYFISKF